MYHPVMSQAVEPWDDPPEAPSEKGLEERPLPVLVELPSGLFVGRWEGEGQPGEDDLPWPPYRGLVVGRWEGEGVPGEDDLPYDDGMPMDGELHNRQLELLVLSLRPWLDGQREAGGKDGYIADDRCLYFDLDEETNKYSSLVPDFMVMLGAESHVRKSWIAWKEGGKTPDLVIELLSDSTRKRDKTDKKAIYQDRLRTPELYWFDPNRPEDLAGFELGDGGYEELEPDADGRLPSNVLGLRLGRWRGSYLGIESVWLRWYTNEGELLPTYEEIERAEKERQGKRADDEAKRADDERTAREQLAKRVAWLEGRLRALGHELGEEEPG